MAAFQFTVEQVSFPSEGLPEDSSSVDSFGSVVDPNVDFISENKGSVAEKDSQSMLCFTMLSVKLHFYFPNICYARKVL